MDNSLDSRGSDARQRPNRFFVNSLLFLDRVEKWLAGFFEMTQEEQNEAGIYIDNDQRDQP
jgi:hypothetical protein